MSIDTLQTGNPEPDTPDSETDVLESPATGWSGLNPWAQGGIIAAVVAAAWILTANFAPDGLPLGVVALGLIFGSTTGLTSVGLILIWRANRVINFANMAIAGIGGMVAVQLFQTWGWPYGISVAIGPLVGLGIGALVEITVIRRFANAPRLVLTVATIGLAQLLGGIELLIPPRIFGSTALVLPPFTTPLSTIKFDLGPVQVDGNDLLPLLVVPVVVVALAWFMRRSLAGVATAPRLRTLIAPGCSVSRYGASPLRYGLSPGSSPLSRWC